MQFQNGSNGQFWHALPIRLYEAKKAFIINDDRVINGGFSEYRKYMCRTYSTSNVVVDVKDASDSFYIWSLVICYP